MNSATLGQWIKRKKTRNHRVGHHREATHTIATSFAGLSAQDVVTVQKWYATGYFTQKELARIFGASTGIVNKCCRCVRVSQIAYVVTPKSEEQEEKEIA